MWNTEEALAWVTLTRAPGLTVTALRGALQHLGDARGLLAASDRERVQAGLPPRACEYLSSTAAAPTRRERQWVEADRHWVVPFSDARFPTLLNSLADCPVALYVVGNVDALADPQLAVVGSRNPTPQGRDTAFDLAEYLAERGLAIGSGMAEGIDAAAHRGALRAQGITIAVQGTGIDLIYPRVHGELASQIATQGALLSEFPLGTPPRGTNFPRRNRLIAALAQGTLVVEAARRSGSLITARLANELGREVFAVPGSIYNPMSRGCHELIKQGAKLVETADDILNELNFSAFFPAGPRLPTTPRAGPDISAGMDKAHKILLDALGFDPADLDTLVVRTGLKPEAVSSMMLMLELEGHVQAAPGRRYTRVVNRSRR